MQIINALLSLIENPGNKKAYEDLKKYYKSLDMKNEAEAIELLINKRFTNADHISDNKI